MTEDLTDLALTELIKENNDEEALDELISRHSGIYVDMLKKFGFKCLTHNQVQDIMQDKDYVIYKAALEYDAEKAKFSTHLANKAKYMCLTQKTKTIAFLIILRKSNFIKKTSPSHQINPAT